MTSLHTTINVPDDTNEVMEEADAVVVVVVGEGEGGKPVATDAVAVFTGVAGTAGVTANGPPTGGTPTPADRPIAGATIKALEAAAGEVVKLVATEAVVAGTDGGPADGALTGGTPAVKALVGAALKAPDEAAVTGRLGKGAIDSFVRRILKPF